MCKILGKLIERIKSYKNFRFRGLTPKPKAKIWKFWGEFVAPAGDYRVYKNAGKILENKGDIGDQRKPFGAPSGETGSRRLETGQKCSSGSRDL